MQIALDELLDLLVPLAGVDNGLPKVLLFFM